MLNTLSYCPCCGADISDVREPQRHKCIGPTPFTPTPEQIAAECAAIREQWSDAERNKRCGMTLANLDRLHDLTPTFATGYVDGCLALNPVG